MSSSNKKIIVVVGATGNQGGSVANTFLTLPNWHVRCITRNPSSSKAQKLASLGAEVVKADLSDQASLTIAFKDANAIFLNTDFWETYAQSTTASGSSPKSSSQAAYDLEVSHGKNAAVAASTIETLEVFIYSALPPMNAPSKGKYPHSYHWESKAAIVSYIFSSHPSLAKKTSLIYLGAYATNPLFTPRLNEESKKWIFALPMKKEARMPIIDPVTSTGPFVRALFEEEEKGTKLLAYDSYMTISEIVNTWSEATGKEGMFVEVSAEKMNREFGVPIEVLDAPGFIEEFGFMGGVEGWIEPGELKRKVETRGFGEWVRRKDVEELQQSAKNEIEKLEE
jgi:hypothetical protein